MVVSLIFIAFLLSNSRRWPPHTVSLGPPLRDCFLISDGSQEYLPDRTGHVFCFVADYWPWLARIGSCGSICRTDVNSKCLLTDQPMAFRSSSIAAHRAARCGMG